MQWFPPIPLLSYLAPHCRGMELGTSVLVLPFFHPILVAEAMAFVDVACGGLSFLGVAAGWNAREFATLGIPMERRLRRLEEGMEIIRRLWTEDDVTFEGREYRLEGVSLSLKPLRKPRPPIWVGASTERVVQRVAGLADALVLSSHIPLAGLERLIEGYRGRRAELNLPPVAHVPVLRNVFVAETAEAALAEGLPYLEAAYGHYGDWGLFRDVLKSGVSAGGLPDAVLDRVVIGGPDEVAAGLETVRRRLGATRVLMVMQWYGMPEERVERSIRLFGERVLPRLRET
jgi:alkanesulfonate monooxygenase SsuD/methylene tetrahydromethanopterin reductase-like flavin-dependent oxidoreductase (luciferase family)